MRTAPRTRTSTSARGARRAPASRGRAGARNVTQSASSTRRLRAEESPAAPRRRPAGCVSGEHRALRVREVRRRPRPRGVFQKPRAPRAISASVKASYASNCAAGRGCQFVRARENPPAKKGRNAPRNRRRRRRNPVDDCGERNENRPGGDSEKEIAAARTHLARRLRPARSARGFGRLDVIIEHLPKGKRSESTRAHPKAMINDQSSIGQSRMLSSRGYPIALAGAPP